MTSKERHEARYQRRKAKREQVRIKRNEGHTFETITSPENLRKAFYSARKNVNWKASVQRYGCNVIKNSIETSIALRNGTWKSKGFIEFDLMDRGKKRHITSVHISERVIQKSVCDYGIVPVIEKSLITYNSASQKGKGTDFAREGLKKHLRRFYRKYGTDGYILLGDCHNFFGSIDHSVVRKNLEKLIADEKLIELTMQFVTPFDKGLGLGSQVCQINAVSYQNSIDHCITGLRECKGYGRYMDDFYALTRTKEEAKKILEITKNLYTKIGIQLNEQKTQIVKLTHGFVWLQDRFYLLQNGRIINKPGRTAVVRNRRKMKRLHRKLLDGEITFKQIQNFYASHMGYLACKNAYYTRRNMDKLFNDLFIRGFVNGQNSYA